MRSLRDMLVEVGVWLACSGVALAGGYTPTSTLSGAPVSALSRARGGYGVTAYVASPAATPTATPEPEPLTWDLYITTPTNGAIYTLTPNAATNCYVAWGDTTTTTLTGTTAQTHSYATAGNYVISISGIVGRIAIPTTAPRNAYLTKTSIIGGVPRLNTIVALFYNQSSLTNVDENTFYFATNVTEIGKAANNGTFQATGIVNAPSGLFRSQPLANNALTLFTACASLTNIGSGIFSNQTGITTFASTLQDCTSLTFLPSGLLDACTNVTTFSSFCYRSSAITTLPAGLHSKNTKVTTYNQAYDGGTGNMGITNLPSDLIPDSTNLTAVSYMFRNCRSMKGSAIPFWDTNRWPNISAAGSKAGCYLNCTNLSDYSQIPLSYGGTNAVVPQ